MPKLEYQSWACREQAWWGRRQRPSDIIGPVAIVVSTAPKRAWERSRKLPHARLQGTEEGASAKWDQTLGQTQIDEGLPSSVGREEPPDPQFELEVRLISFSASTTDNGAAVSALGMNNKCEVRSASEFKTIFEQTGESHRPYRCPFCEVPYEDRCIITECRKAPHFKLPNGTDHRGKCNGEAGEISEVGTKVPSSRPSRKVIGDIDYPVELVPRRAPLILKDVRSGLSSTPDEVEIGRRRRIVASDQTLSTKFTSSDIRSFVHAYKNMLKEAYDIATGERLVKGTTEYNASFKATLESHPLVLYGQRTSYRRAFQSSKLHPWSAARIYHGRGTVTLDDDDFVIVDSDLWPLAPKSTKALAPSQGGKFEVRFQRALASDAPTSHRRALAELESKIGMDFRIEWYAYGTPQLKADSFTLMIASMDHLYWIGQHRR